MDYRLTLMVVEIFLRNKKLERTAELWNTKITADSFIKKGKQVQWNLKQVQWNLKQVQIK